jgi:hypothetical protein
MKHIKSIYEYFDDFQQKNKNFIDYLSGTVVSPELVKDIKIKPFEIDEELDTPEMIAIRSLFYHFPFLQEFDLIDTAPSYQWKYSLDHFQFGDATIAYDISLYITDFPTNGTLEIELVCEILSLGENYKISVVDTDDNIINCTFEEIPRKFMDTISLIKKFDDKMNKEYNQEIERQYIQTMNIN